MPAECPAPTGECQIATCEGGVCGTSNVPDGTAAGQQTAGDCSAKVCTSGSIGSKPDNTDVGDDGNECTVDGCSAGSPTTSPAAVGTPCSANGGKVCDASATCVGCNENADCDAATPLCDSTKCVPIDCTDNVKNGNETSIDCGGLCAPCENGKDCLLGADCKSGVCTGNVCQAPTCDDGVKNDVETDVDCGGAKCLPCGPDKGCDTAEDCAGNQCTGVGGTCIPNCQDKALGNQETDVDCGGPNCAKCGVGQMCGASDANCISAAYCGAGVCTLKKTQAKSCDASNECASAACADGVCCNVPCVGTCRSCALPGVVGLCSYFAPNTDPENDCAGNGGQDACNGEGLCAKATGGTCGDAPDCASGYCIDGYCCDGPCNTACKACAIAKTGQPNGTCSAVTPNTDPDNECAGTLLCAGNGCAPPTANGTACTDDNECISGACVDGVCCNSPCTFACRACNLPGSLGTCDFIPNGQDPANECVGASTCNGAGSCN